MRCSHQVRTQAAKPHTSAISSPAWEPTMNCGQASLRSIAMTPTVEPWPHTPPAAQHQPDLIMSAIPRLQPLRAFGTTTVPFRPVLLTMTAPRSEMRHTRPRCTLTTPPHRRIALLSTSFSRPPGRALMDFPTHRGALGMTRCRTPTPPAASATSRTRICPISPMPALDADRISSIAVTQGSLTA